MKTVKMMISGKETSVTKVKKDEWVGPDGRMLGAYDGGGDPDNPVPVLYDGSGIYIATDKVVAAILKNQA